ncbi:hypothetical protein [Pseudomonas sp. NPDC088444]|uniref:hypothetical protein n=1 Tax=Pseudomonas sp. NPDC088444 TaxID=3364456 RepID=UPI00384CC917
MKLSVVMCMAAFLWFGSGQGQILPVFGGICLPWLVRGSCFDVRDSPEGHQNDYSCSAWAMPVRMAMSEYVAGLQAAPGLLSLSFPADERSRFGRKPLARHSARMM